MSSGAPAPPILVATQPGVSAFDSTSGQRRATANAIVQLALGVGRRSIPAPLAPQDVVEMRARAIMHARAQIDDALRPFDQRGEDIGSKRVDGEHMRQAVAGDAMTLTEADRGIVNDRIESAERVDLLRNVLGGCDRHEIA